MGTKELEFKPIEYLDDKVGPCDKARRDSLRADYILPTSENMGVTMSPAKQQDALLDYIEKIKAFGISEDEIAHNIKRKQDDLKKINGEERVAIIEILGKCLSRSARAIELVTASNQNPQSLIPVREKRVVFKRT